MASNTAVVDDSQDPVQNGEGKQEREQSRILFPYQSLNEAVAVAKAVHEVQGSSCTLEQLAAHLGQSPTSSSFRLRISTAKIFGLVTYSQGTIALTRIGTQICDPQQEAAARVDSFLAVPLYKAVYEQFKGATIPPTSGFEAALVGLGVAQKQKERSRQVLQRSAQEAGFFQYGTERLVLPPIKASAAAIPAVAPTGEPEPEKKKKTKEEDEDDLHPFIKGLLRKLPTPETEWPSEGRAKWLQAAINIFDLMYTDSEDSRKSLTIGFQKDSARQ
jgi:hypothetical protein